MPKLGSRLPLALLFAALFATGGGAGAQALPGADDRVLEKADAALVAPDSSCTMRLSVATVGGSLEYSLKLFVKDWSRQRAVFESPDFDRGDSAIRRGAVAYFKYRAWPKYDAMSARSSFLDSPLTWEDALCPALAAAYQVAATSWEDVGGERLLRCVLTPRAPDGYRKIELWLQGGSYRTEIGRAHV